MLDELALFVHIVKSGTLKKAAHSSGLPAATVTRRLQKLEHQLECKLIHRNSHQFTLTNEGQKLYEESVFLVESLEAKTKHFRGELKESAGKIKILAPIPLATGILAPHFSDFLQQHPDIDIEFVLSNQIDNFLTSGADFAIRIGPRRFGAIPNPNRPY